MRVWLCTVCMHGYVCCMSMYIWLCIYGYVYMAMYVWLCMYDDVFMAMYGYVCMTMYLWPCIRGYICVCIVCEHLLDNDSLYNHSNIFF